MIDMFAPLKISESTLLCETADYMPQLAGRLEAIPFKGREQNAYRRGAARDRSWATSHPRITPLVEARRIDGGGSRSGPHCRLENGRG